MRLRTFLYLLSVILLRPVLAEDKPLPSSLREYFKAEVGSLEGRLTGEIQTGEDWLKNKDQYRHQLAEMLGLDPMPKRSDLKAVKTGEFEHEGIIVENLHYQSMPGLYVTANLYRPKVVEKPLPTILYVCGHSKMEKGGISYGNKAGYEHHGVWYARHGFVCLVIDTVQLGEILGEHHGTFSKGRWWWLSRGYTPAGVEAWAGIRGLDYLETRTEVDKTRFGVTGRSGGGAYSWWIAALDERIKAAAPTAGVTTLHSHVLEGVVEGHCDCMFMVNTYRWDYDKLAALVAPRALCILNTDKDEIFPLDEVMKLHGSVRRIYSLLGAEKNLGLQIAEGGHKDTQPLNAGEFHWMIRSLQGADVMSTMDTPAVKSIPMEKLRVFTGGLPADQRNTTIDETFVPKAATPAVPADANQWAAQRDALMTSIKDKCFATQKSGIAAESATASRAEPPVSVEGVTMRRVLSTGKAPFSASADLWLMHREGLPLQDLELVVLNVLDEKGWSEFTATYASRFPSAFPAGTQLAPDEDAFASEKKVFASSKSGMAYLCPRGVDPTAWDDATLRGTGHLALNPMEKAAADKKSTHQLRRFYLLGTTLHSEQVGDIRRGLHLLRRMEGLQNVKLWLQGTRLQAGNALYASLFEDGITRLDLHELPHSHDQGPFYLNVMKYLDLPQAAALAAERTRVIIYDNDRDAWSHPQQVSDKLGWASEEKRGFQIRETGKAE